MPSLYSPPPGASRCRERYPSHIERISFSNAQASLSVKASLSRCIIRPMAKDEVDLDRAARIKYVRKSLLQLDSQQRFAEVLSSHIGAPLTRGAVGNWERGLDIGIDNLKAISELAGISLDWLAHNAGEKPAMVGNIPSTVLGDGGAYSVPLLGYVRAGAAAHFYAAAPDPLEWVPNIKDQTRDTAALQIQGESLGSFFDQWLVYYDEIRSPVTPDLIGKLCVVGLMDDRVVIKKIKRAKTDGLYNLLSNEGKEDILDVEIVWAARVKHMTPR